MSSLFKITTEGKLRAGVDPKQFVDNFSRVFKVSQDQAEKILNTSHAITLKDNIDKHTADKFQRVLHDQIGLLVMVVEIPVQNAIAQESISYESVKPDESPSSNTKTSSNEGVNARCPKCGSDNISADECLSCGIIISRYRAKQAEQENTQKNENKWNPYQTSDTQHVEDNDVGNQIRAVDAGDAWQWIVGGWRFFIQNPFVWIGTIIIWYVIMFVAGLIPFIGSLAINIFSPVFVGGLMLGVNEQASGGNLTVGHLFRGFSTEFGKLVQSGLLYLASIIAVMIVMGIFLFIFGLGSFLHTAGNMQAVNSFPIIAFFILGMLALVAMALLGMAFYFVPLLIVFDGLSPTVAMKQSFTACWTNWLPFLVYGLILFGLGILAVIPVGLGIFVLAPVIFASVYVSYRHIFHGEV